VWEDELQVAGYAGLNERGPGEVGHDRGRAEGGPEGEETR
jgi:hypothetical protein